MTNTKKIFRTGLVTAALLFLTACGNHTAPVTDETSSMARESSTSSPIPETTETPSKVSETAESSSKAPAPETSDPTTPAAETSSDAAQSLTSEELEFFTQYFNQPANNGFLCSSYSQVTEADLNEVFYNGAGLSMVPFTQEMYQAFAQFTGSSVHTDIIRVTAAQMDEFLTQKTGYPSSRFQIPDTWAYLKEFDLYATQHGDTSLISIRIVNGSKDSGGTYTLSYEADPFSADAWVASGTVTLKKQEDSYLIVSNEITAGGILNQNVFPLSPADISRFTTDADTSSVDGFDKNGDYSAVTKENLQGTWFCERDNIAFYFDGDDAYVFYPLLDLYGNTRYEWEVEDRSSRGLCPALYVYFNGSTNGPLAYYISGVEKDFFWSNTDMSIFYKQK